MIKPSPINFPATISDVDLYLFSEGTKDELWNMLGANICVNDGTPGVAFAVWAPNAQAVSVMGDFCDWDRGCYPMRCLGDSGVYEVFIPHLSAGTVYKFAITTQSGELIEKSDPYAKRCELPPQTASVVCANDNYSWDDKEWLERRAVRDIRRSPLVVYELHLGSWKRDANNNFLNYREIAKELVTYVKAHGFNAVELMPIAEHPFYGSWGYQVSGYFAPTARYGSPDDFRYFVDFLHQENIDVIIDWVPAHFVKDDFALGRFDGTALYEHEDPKLAEHPDWGTYIFNYGRQEVRAFLIANALYWCQEFHIDGLRVDAVASMLYLDYSRKEGEWSPNKYGGNENLEAAKLLRDFNYAVHHKCPGAYTIAEESTAYAGVTKSVHEGGLGFDFKWNMGWMHDTLSYFKEDPIHRKYHHGKLTFAMLYEYSETFINPISHDEVVHGKGSLLNKMPGDHWQKEANTRLLLAYQYTRPGKILQFMGAETSTYKEWNHDEAILWDGHLIEDNPQQKLLAALGELYFESPAFWQRDPDENGFEWIDCNDHENSVISYVRKSEKQAMVVVLNLTPVPRSSYAIGAPFSGRYKRKLSTDDSIFGGSGVVGKEHLYSVLEPIHGRGQCLLLDLPPLGALIYRFEGTIEPSDDKLLKQFNIKPCYTNIEGHTVTIPPQTATALLTSLGCKSSQSSNTNSTNSTNSTTNGTHLKRGEKERGKKRGDIIPLISATQVLEQSSVGDKICLSLAKSVRVLGYRFELCLEDSTRITTVGDAGLVKQVTLTLPQAMTGEKQHCPLGYHKITLTLLRKSGEEVIEQSFIVVPSSCYLGSENKILRQQVEQGEDGKVSSKDSDGDSLFGLCANLYAVRSESNEGIGDLNDLAELCKIVGGQGGHFVGINPIHAAENRWPNVSPYSPVSRLYKNPLYISFLLFPEELKEDDFNKNTPRLESQDSSLPHKEQHKEQNDTQPDAQIDYDAVWGDKLTKLKVAFDKFIKDNQYVGNRGQEFTRYKLEQGETLQWFAIFNVLMDHFEHKGGKATRSYFSWPNSFQKCTSKQVTEFAGKHPKEVDFYCWLQFILEEQLSIVAEIAKDAGMTIGVYQDLAVGSAGDSFDRWAFSDLFAEGVSIGAPPDPLGPQGQNWGLPPLKPNALQKSGFSYWIKLLQNNMKYGGALRIDHAIGLVHQFWIPDNMPASQGAYVAFPLDELLGILALESHRNKSLVIAEDLGTVPPELPRAMDKWGMLSTTVMLFSRGNNGSFLAPHDYPSRALLTANTHDVIPLWGWWNERDIDLAMETGLMNKTEGPKKREQRERDRNNLREATSLPQGKINWEQLAQGVHRYLLQSDAKLIGIWLEDLMGEKEPINIPGLCQEQYPCWSRRLPKTLGSIKTQLQAALLSKPISIHHKT